MPALLLIRHGDNDYLAKNKLPGHIPGIHLNQHGREQAVELANTLGKLPVKAIYSSPLERAIETAHPLAQSLGLAIQIRPNLTDTDPGEWAGRSLKVLSHTNLWKVIQNTPSQAQFPGGETFIRCQERVVNAVSAITSAHKDDLVAIFCHGDPIKLSVAHFLGMPLDHFQSLSISPGSVTILKINGSNIKLLGLNLIPPFSFTIS